MNRVRITWYWILQVVFWALIFLLIQWGNSTNPKPENTTPEARIAHVFIFIFGILVTHWIRWVLKRLGWIDFRYGLIIPRYFLASVVGGVALALLLNTPYLVTHALSELNWINDAIICAVFIFIWLAGHYAIQLAFKSHDQEVNHATLQSEKNEIELQVLRSQLNPHFLFNSLNTVRALVDIDPELAKTGIGRLANLLRKSLVSGKKNLITLKEEFEIVNEYIELEKIRFEERVQVVIHHDEGLDNVNIPPFIIQTLVENAMKHGITKLIDGGTITVSTFRKNSSTIIRIENDGKLSNSTDTGVGLENTIRRLELEYKGKASLSLYETQTTVVAEIEIRD